MPDPHPAILNVRNPRNGQMDYTIPVTTADQIAQISQSLRTAQKLWSVRSLEDRITVLRTWADVLDDHRADIVAALRTDTGRHALANTEVDAVIGGIARWTALAPSLTPAPDTPASHFPNITARAAPVPYSLVGAISPWNFPFLLATIDAIPALLAGSAVIIKPSEVTPRFIDPVRKTIDAVPELADVFAFVEGDGTTGAALIDHVDLITFTGSVATGRKVAEAAARNFMPAFLELGGKDPVIVLEGSDIDRATTAILRASVAGTGQACQSLERLYVHSSLHDNFAQMLTDKAKSVPLSFPDPDRGVIGPLIFAKQASIIEKQLADAIANGAKVHCGGEILHHGGGVWIEPTVLTGVTHNMAIMVEETFGPIMPVMSFETPEEAIELANDSDFGLSGAVFGPDEATAEAIARQINAGGITLQDAGATVLVHEFEKSAFKLSGMGPSRMGPTGYTRFFRHRTLYINRGDVLPITIFGEKDPGP